jgi:hypothetical protein
VQRLGRYLLSWRNLLGLALGVVALVLHAFGIPPVLWPLTVIGGYLVGAVIAPGRRPPRLQQVEYRPQVIRRALDGAYDRTHGRTPPDVQTTVARIRQRILELLPHLDQLPAGSRDRFVIQRTAVSYLPATLDAYLALPPFYATGHRVDEERTPLDVLREQLALLDAKMEEVAQAVYERDTERLLANGRFLEEHFGTGELRLEANTSPARGVDDGDGSG